MSATTAPSEIVMKPVFTAALAAIVIALPATAAFTRGPAPALAQVRVSGPLGVSIVGTTHDVRIVDDGATVGVIVGLRKLTTGMAFRDEHMRDKYLEVERFPETKLAVARASLAETKGAEVAARGALTLHGKTKLVPFTYRASCAGELCDVSGRVTVDMNDFGIVVAPYFGLTVQKDVVVDVAFQARRA